MFTKPLKDCYFFHSEESSTADVSVKYHCYSMLSNVVDDHSYQPAYSSGQVTGFDGTFRCLFSEVLQDYAPIPMHVGKVVACNVLRLGK